MATTIVLTNQAGTANFTPLYTLGSTESDRLFVGADATLTTTGSNSPIVLMQRLANELTILGTLYAAGSDAIRLAQVGPSPSLGSRIDIGADAYVFGGSGSGIQLIGFGHSVTNAGEIVSNGQPGLTGTGAVVFGNAVAASAGTGPNVLVNSGRLSGWENGVVSLTAGTRVENTGTISGSRGDGIEIGGPDAAVFNRGTISGGDIGVTIAAGDNAFIGNAGSIWGTGAGVALSSSGGALSNSGVIEGGIEGVRLENAGAMRVVNTGTISGLREGLVLSGANSAYVLNDGILAGDGAGGRGFRTGSSEAVVLINNGVIDGVTIDGRSADVRNAGEIERLLDFSGQSGANGVNVLRNTGRIGGEVDAVFGTITIENIYNAGTIVGNIGLGGAGDLYDGTGGVVLAGRIFGGDGNDTLLGGDGADTLSGVADRDLLRGGAGDDSLEGEDRAPDTLDGEGGNDALFAYGGGLLIGGDGNDTIAAFLGAVTLIGDGGASVTAPGNDLLQATESDDSLSGGGGADTLYGDDGDDTMQGGAGQDLLFGGTGLDRLTGGDGADTLQGNQGNDFLRGGGGADHFVYAVDDNPAFGDDLDVILDFQAATDVLVLLVPFGAETTFGYFSSLDTPVRVTDGGVGGPMIIEFGWGDTIILQGVGIGADEATPYADSLADLVAAGWSILVRESFLAT
jgi:Ca2+-binding RTX toxin-like protein